MIAKKYTSLLLILTIILAMSVEGITSVLAAGSSDYFYGDEYRYTIETDGTITLDYYIGDKTEVTVPLEIDGKTVAKIDWACFYDAREFDAVKVTKISIPQSIIEISNGALQGCSKLEEIVVDENNQYFKSVDGCLFSKDGKSFLQYCAANPRSSYTFPNTVEKILGYGAFEYAYNLTDIIIPNSVKYIDDYTFEDCVNLTHIKLPETYYVLNTGLFQGCKSLKNIELPESLEAIEWRAFANSGLERIFIPKNVNQIADSAFRDCAELKEFDVDSSNSYYADVDGVLFNKDLTTLINYPLANDCAVYSVPSSVKIIADNACDASWVDEEKQLPKLRKLILPGNLEVIGHMAFEGCANLEEIKIGDKIREIGGFAFGNTKYYKNKDNWEDDVLYIGNAVVASDWWNDKTVNTVFIKQGTTIIADSAFWCEAFKGVVVPSTVKYIGKGSFADCDKTELVIILNPDCSIDDSERTIYKDSVVYGYDGSTAENYSQKYDRTFISLNSYNCADENHLYLIRDKQEATHTENGFINFKCAICGKTYSETIEKLSHTGVPVFHGEADGIHAECDECCFDEDAFLRVSHDASVTDPLAEFGIMIYGVSTVQKLYYIHVQNERGEYIQPKPGHKVTLRIPLIYDDFGNSVGNEDTYRIYHVDSETGRYESFRNSRNNLRIEDGYLIIEVDHFSPFVVAVEEDPTVSIRNNPNKAMLRYGETMVLTADTKNLPEGAKIAWETDSGCVTLKPSVDGATCEVTSKKNGTATVTVKIIDAGGNPIESDEKAISDSETIQSKAGFFDCLRAFFMRLFGIVMRRTQNVSYIV